MSENYIEIIKQDKLFPIIRTKESEEAIEISKDFGAEDSYKFINAVLDNVRKDLEKTNE